LPSRIHQRRAFKFPWSPALPVFKPDSLRGILTFVVVFLYPPPFFFFSLVVMRNPRLRQSRVSHLFLGSLLLPFRYRDERRPTPTSYPTLCQLSESILIKLSLVVLYTGVFRRACLMSLMTLFHSSPPFFSAQRGSIPVIALRARGLLRARYDDPQAFPFFHFFHFLLLCGPAHLFTL